LQRKWPKEASNSEDNLYKSFWLVYNREMDFLVLNDKISREIKKENHHS
jgi:hypothetical protein